MIRKGTLNDIQQIALVYDSARAYMRKQGFCQWADGYPGANEAKIDIERNVLYVLENENGIYATFTLAGGNDPTYNTIENGEWKSSTPYLTIHRVASDGTQKGIFSKIVAFAKGKSNHLRIDTHQQNENMQGLIEANGFEYCGIIHLANGSPRMAYEYIK